MRTDNRTRPLRNSVDTLRGQKDSKHYLTQLIFVTESFVGVNIYQFILSVLALSFPFTNSSF